MTRERNEVPVFALAKANEGPYLKSADWKGNKPNSAQKRFSCRAGTGTRLLHHGSKQGDGGDCRHSSSLAGRYRGHSMAHRSGARRLCKRVGADRISRCPELLSSLRRPLIDCPVSALRRAHHRCAIGFLWWKK